ncbi:hypothetical protein ACFLT7_06300 [candidate division KSB1 bacterium]
METMQNPYHTFHIPVMGTGHSADTPIRVAPFGINSVISLVDDILLENIRKYYCDLFGLPYSKIPVNTEGGRAKRITAYLNTVHEIVQIKMKSIKKQSLFEASDKRKYFELLPDSSPLKKAYLKCISMKAGIERDSVEKDLTRKMTPGSIDINIMVKLDRTPHFNGNKETGEELSDAKSALKGYADSILNSSVVFSAGINRSLFTYMTRFREFYRDHLGEIKKKIVLKVSDFRSAYVQGLFLAKNGLEVYEFRVESGINCGGHVFPSNGMLLPGILQEFKEKCDELTSTFMPKVRKYYQNKKWLLDESIEYATPLLSVQGGIGNHGEAKRLVDDFDVDLTGWASPFLLVPEATCVDDNTRELLRQSNGDKLYLSNVSPLRVLFSNVRNSGSEKWTLQRIKDGKPGSPCPKGFLEANTEFTDRPICIASRQYQKKKLEQINLNESNNGNRERLIAEVLEKTCICDHLGNGAICKLGIDNEENAPPSICPGPNINWFNSTYTLQEMVDHIYGKNGSLVPPERPHMFAKEIEIYADYFEKLMNQSSGSSKEMEYLKAFKSNLENDMDFCLEIAKKTPYKGENLASIPPCVERERTRLNSLYEALENRAAAMIDEQSN